MKENKDIITGRLTITLNGVEYTADVKLAPAAPKQTPRSYKAWGVRIDRHNDNPEAAVEYIGEAAGYKPAHAADAGDWGDNPVYSRIRPCIMQNGTVAAYLDPDDFTKIEGGSPINALRGDFDVMIEFGKIYYRITQDDRYTYVEVTDDDAALADGFTDYAHSYKGKVRDTFYIGAYKASMHNGRLRSIPGEMPARDMTIGRSRTAAQANGEGYEITPFNKLTLLQALYLIRYKSRDSRTALGKGLTEAREYGRTGETSKRGMYYGEPDGNTRVKCFGIEDFYGNVFEWIDGLMTTDWILIADGNFNDTGKGYEEAATLTDNIYGVMTEIGGDNRLGFLPKAADDDLDPGESDYCTYASLWKSDRGYVPIFGGSAWNGADAGAFYLDCECDVSVCSSNVGSRLCFCGKGE